MSSDIVTSIPNVPVTQARPVPIGLDKHLPQPGVWGGGGVGGGL